jgi:hypothetical protein
MKTEKFNGSIGSFLGEKINPPLKFDGSFEAYESFDELKSANALPSNDEIVDFVNVKRKNNERQRVMQTTLEEKGYSKPDPNDPIVAAQTMIRNVEKMENMKPEQKQMMIAVLRQQIVDEEAKRKAAAESAPVSA